MAQFRDLKSPKLRMHFKGKPIKKRTSAETKARRKIYYEKNRHAIIQKRRSNPDKTATNLRYHLKAYYGLAVDDYMKMVLDQNGCCAICFRHQSKLKKRLYVDHSHKNHKVRGLLCSRCNLLLGKARDCASLLRVAADYLEERNGAI